MSRPISSRCAEGARVAVIVGAASALAGCEGSQAVLDPAGPISEAIASLGWTMFIGAAVIFAAVFTLLGFGVFGRERARRLVADRRTIVVAGVAIPVVVLTALLIYGLILERRSDPTDGLTISVTGERWWWRVAYETGDGGVIAAANEIRLPQGEPVRLRLLSADVIHSFWVPALGGKLDMIPGRVNTMTLEADRPGTYRGQCAEFCGDQHALMAFTVTVMEPEAFGRWLDGQAAPATEPVSEEAVAGQEVFTAQGCGACHTIRGTGAAGVIGPDLTHLASRPTIAAGTLPNNAGTLAGWVADAQAIKPGALMPSFTTIAGPDLRALAAYLGELE